jgi:hypothetical protein
MASQLHHRQKTKTMKPAYHADSSATCVLWLNQHQISRTTIIILLSALLFCISAFSQNNSTVKKLNYFHFALSNSHTAMPYGSFSQLFYKEFHPGVEIGTGLNWSVKKKHDWYQTFKLGYSYHEFVQRTLMLYSEFGYRYKFPLGISGFSSLGAGWMRSLQDAEVFTMNEDGEYVNAKKGRYHGMATFSIGASKQISKSGFQLFMNYQQRFQFSFIDAYVPALPVNSMFIGVQIPLHKK